MIVAGLTAANVPAAHAAAGDLTICNHSLSWVSIQLWRDGPGWNAGISLWPGACHNSNNINGDLNVDMDRNNLGVRSWKAGKGSPGHIVYGRCSEDNPYAFSIPVQWNNSTVVFRNYQDDGC